MVIAPMSKYTGMKDLCYSGTGVRMLDIPLTVHIWGRF